MGTALEKSLAMSTNKVIVEIQDQTLEGSHGALCDAIDNAANHCSLVEEDERSQSQTAIKSLCEFHCAETERGNDKVGEDFENCVPAIMGLQKQIDHQLSAVMTSESESSELFRILVVVDADGVDVDVIKTIDLLVKMQNPCGVEREQLMFSCSTK